VFGLEAAVAATYELTEAFLLSFCSRWKRNWYV